MDFFFHYRNPNFHVSSSLVITNNKTSNSFHGKEVMDQKKRNKRTNNNNKMITTKMKLSTDPQSVAARERRHRISEKFKILRSLIPGCDTRNMDTVSMLEEAIQYVKYLKSQIWLHQTMISFENFDDYDHDAACRSSYNNLDHQPFDHNQLADHHFYGDYHLHEMLPQLGFAEGSSLRVEGHEDNMAYLSRDDHQHANYP